MVIDLPIGAPLARATPRLDGMAEGPIAQRAPRRRRAVSSLQSPRVLVCDDNDSVRALIVMNLELEGYDVLEARDGQEALEILGDTHSRLPDVVTVDALMPRRDGWWTVNMIRIAPN